MSNTSLAIILLATLALTLIVPVVSGVSLLQHVKAETSGQKGMDGISHCTGPICFVTGGNGGVGNDGNLDNSNNGNGGRGGIINSCGNIGLATCAALGGGGGNNNSHNRGSSSNGNGGNGGTISCPQRPTVSLCATPGGN